MEMKLSKEILDRGLKLAENARYMGIPLSEMTRDELLAIAAEGWDMYSRKLEESKSSIRLLNDLHKIKY